MTIKYPFREIILIVLFASFQIAIAQESITIGNPTNNPGPFKIEGRVVSKNSSETLPGASIRIDDGIVNSVADERGRFSLTLEKGYYSLYVSFVGYEKKEINIYVRNNGTVKIELEETHTQIDEVIIYDKKPDTNIKGVTMGKTDLSIASIEALPPFAGELDVLKSITLLPGISTVGEASSGFNVRGGGSDQNLIMLDKVTLYNPSHLFGFFSAFNSDVLSNVSVYKGVIPAMYGGRGSSIIDLSYKKGNPSKWQGKASIGTISGKFLVDGPIIKDKFTVLVGGRSSYSNWILNSVEDPQIGNSSANFYDVNALLHYKLNARNIIEYSIYHSYDNFKLLQDTSYSWQNSGHVLKWNHAVHDSLSFNLTVLRSGYDFNIDNVSGIENFNLKSSIIEYGTALDFIYSIGRWGNLYFGVQGKLIQISPGNLVPIGSNSGIIPKEIESEQGLEVSPYFQHELSFLNDKIGFSYGLRYSRFMYMGENTVFEYADNKPRSEENITGSTLYKDYEVIKTYDRFEPRLSLRYSFNESTSIKGGFNRINQYINLISNTASIAPSDIWKLSDTYLLPQTVTQFSIGFFKNFKDNGIETSIEAYYKDQENIIEYKDGAELILNDHLETELLNGNGRSYGLELYFRRKIGFLRGWVGYTYSRSFRQVIGGFPEELINNGDWYPSYFDKPHDLTATLELQFSPNVKFSGILTYSTGRAITYPVAKFNYFGKDYAYFTNRNGERAPDYMRIDASWYFKFNSKKKLFNGELTVAVFNLLGRKNAFSVFFNDVEGVPPQAYQLSILGIPFPSMSYSFSF